MSNRFVTRRFQTATQHRSARHFHLKNGSTEWMRGSSHPTRVYPGLSLIRSGLLCYLMDIFLRVLEI